MRDEVGLVGLREATEARDERVGFVVAEKRKVDVEVVECGQQVCRVEAGRD